MVATTKPFLSLTANDLMSRDVILIPQDMSLRSAAHLLSQSHITGAPVVDGQGRCIGVVSATDFLRWAEGSSDTLHDHAAPPAQSVCSEWQVIDLEMLPPDAVREYMTPDPVTVSPTASIRELARLMLDAHIHRVVVVDKQHRPAGIVSTTDILAAVAYGDHAE